MGNIINLISFWFNCNPQKMNFAMVCQILSLRNKVLKECHSGMLIEPMLIEIEPINSLCIFFFTLDKKCLLCILIWKNYISHNMYVTMKKWIVKPHTHTGG